MPKQDHVTLVSNADYIARQEYYESKLCFAIMRHSNIGLRFILGGLPVVNLHLAAIDKLVVQEYFPGYPLLVEKLDDLEKILTFPKENIRKFFYFRDQFVASAYPNINIIDHIVSRADSERN
jgi:hypothetical protein